MLNHALMLNLGPEFFNLDLGVTSCFEIGRRVYAGAKALYVRSEHFHSVVQVAHTS